MNAPAIVFDIKFWVALALVLGLVFGFESDFDSQIITLMLIAQMTISFAGVSFCRQDFRDYKKNIYVCMFCCFVVNLAITLFVGMFFMDPIGLWYGWIIYACTPCAISILTAAIFVKADLKLATVGTTAIYVLALAVTPVLIYLMLGDRVRPLKIASYILMFIVIPYIAAIPLKKLNLPQKARGMGINLTIFVMTFVAVGAHRDFLFDYPKIIALLAVAAFLRLTVFMFISVAVMRRMKVPREHGMIYMMMSIWKTAGMSMSLAIILLGTTYPAAAVPAIVSLPMEMIWLGILASRHEKLWPMPREDPAPKPASPENN